MSADLQPVPARRGRWRTVTEIGLRRALGARRHHVATQFVVESLLLCGLGGLAGIALGAGATGVYALTSAHPLVVPLSALGGGVGVALAVGAIAGVYRSSRTRRVAASTCSDWVSTWRTRPHCMPAQFAFGLRLRQPPERRTPRGCGAPLDRG